MLKDLPRKDELGQIGVAAALSAAMIRWYVGYKQGLVEPDFGDKKKQVATCMEEYLLLFVRKTLSRRLFVTTRGHTHWLGATALP